MDLQVVLIDRENNINDVVNVYDVDDKNHFSYLDNDKNLCKIDIYEDGLIIDKKGKDYKILLNLRKNSYTMIKTIEGELKINTKVVEFIKNDDILEMHYLVEEQYKEIEIIYKYRS